MSDFASQLDTLFRQDPDRLTQQLRDSVAEKCRRSPDGFVLYGAGYYGRLAASRLAHLGHAPKAFIDANPSLQGREVEGIPVHPLAEYQSGVLGQSLLIVTVYKCVDVLRSLQAQGVDAVTYSQVAVALGEPLLPYCGVQQPKLLWQNEAQIRHALSLWADDESRRLFLEQLIWSTQLDPASLSAASPARETYFAPDIISFGEHETFVDCGAFDGDSVEAFIQRCPGYETAIGLEPDPASQEQFAKRFGGVTPMHEKRISLLPYAASDRSKVLHFNATGTAGSSISEAGISIHAAPLDEVLGEHRPTFIKMDIEGAEPQALQGAQRILSHYMPKLAICVYHERDHLWRIPEIISAIQPGYELRLRRYADECWELVCYATVAA